MLLAESILVTLHLVGTHNLLHLDCLQKQRINEKKVSPKDFLGPGRQHLVQTALLEGKGAVQQGINSTTGIYQ